MKLAGITAFRLVKAGLVQQRPLNPKKLELRLYSSTSAEMATIVKTNLSPQTSRTDTNPPHPKKPGLTLAILRYNSGDERFEFTFKYQDKLFNFSRPISETLQSFTERARTNLAKKIKKFDESSQILWEVKNMRNSENYSDLVFASIFQPETDVPNSNPEALELTFKIGDDFIPVSVNPPEVFKIKMLKKAMTGFPILPIAMEGSPSFVPEKSKYKWEFGSQEDVDHSHKKHLRKKSESEREIWSPCPSSLSVPFFTPDASLEGSVLRLTCIPSDETNSRFGDPHSVESAVLTRPPVTNFLFHERLSRMGDNLKSSDPNFFRVISYNTLSDPCATEEWFTGSPKDSLPMDYRLPLLNLELKAYQADIICLQEVDRKFYESYFKPFLAMDCGLDGVHCCKSAEKSNREGVAMFYNRQKFELVETNPVIILDHMKSLPFFQNLSAELQERLLERSTVLQVCVFKSLNCPNTLVVVANTHLYFHPDADHIRCLQTITAVNFVELKIEQLKAKFPSMSTTALFCGDLNCTPPFSAFRFLTSGKVQENDYDWTSHETEKIIPGIELEHKLNLKNSHPGEELTNIVLKFEGCLDYILYQEKFVHLLNVYPPPSKAKIAEVCGLKTEKEVSLPNFHAGSDHLPVIADFALRS